MRSIKTKTLTAVFLTISLVSVAFGQQGQAPASQYVEEKGFKGRVFEVKYREPGALVQAIGLLGSGFKGASIRYSDEFNTITVRDFPENIAAMEEALKRLDTPQPARAPQPDVQFHIHIMIASNTDLPPGDFPAELHDVVTQLRSTLSYKNYGVMTSVIQRSQGKVKGDVEGSGVAESKLLNLPSPQGNPSFYSYKIVNPEMAAPASGTTVIDLQRFIFNLRVPLSIGTTIQYQNVGFETPLSLREGEKVVVGTTAMGDKGLVVVVSAKVLK